MLRPYSMTRTQNPDESGLDTVPPCAAHTAQGGGEGAHAVRPYTLLHQSPRSEATPLAAFL